MNAPLSYVNIGKEAVTEEGHEKHQLVEANSTFSMTSSEAPLFLKSSKEDLPNLLNPISTLVSNHYRPHICTESESDGTSSHDVIHYPIIEDTVTKFHNIYHKRSQSPCKNAPHQWRKFSVDAHSSIKLSSGSEDSGNVNVPQTASLHGLKEKRRASLPDPKLLPQVTSLEASLLMSPSLLQMEKLQHAHQKRVHGPFHILANRIRKLSIGGGSSNCLSSSGSDVLDDSFPKTKSFHNDKDRRRVSLPDTSHLRSNSSSLLSRYRKMTSPTSKHVDFEHCDNSNKWRHRSALQLHNISPLANERRPSLQTGESALLNSTQRNITILENEKFIIFKNHFTDNSTYTNKFHWESICKDSLKNPNRVFITFLSHATCYDLVPMSSKLLVLDVFLNVKKAFLALIYNGVRAAPLWDSESQRFVGMLTVADFVNILHKNYPSSAMSIHKFENYSIKSWREIFKNKLPNLLSITPQHTLYEALNTLLKAKVHRLPIIDSITGNVIHQVTAKRIIKFLSFFLDSLTLPNWFKWSLKRLNIGTYVNLIVVKWNTPLIKVLSYFVEHPISALPVINEENKLENIYSKFDAINLAAKQSYNNLDISVQEALTYREEHFEGVSTCTQEESLEDVFRRIVQAEIHRLVVVDDERHVIGMVSLSDMLKFLIEPPNNIVNEMELELSGSLF